MHFVCLSVKWTDITIEHLVLFLQSFNMYEVLVHRNQRLRSKLSMSLCEWSFLRRVCFSDTSISINVSISPKHENDIIKIK